jgi:predicted acetyltransferase
MLYPFKTSYYEMFGYAGWPVALWARITPTALAPYMKGVKTGTVRQRLSSEAKEDFYALLQSAQRNVHGMASAPKVRFDNQQDARPKWFASVHEGDEITGGLSYTMNLDKRVLEGRAVFWLTENARLQLLDFLARHVDQVSHITMPILPGQHPHLWVTDDEAVTVSSEQEHAWNAPMGRIVSVTGLNGIGAGEGSVALTIRDDQGPWNDGVWTFAGTNGVLEVTQGGEPEGEITIGGLAALVMSGMDPVTLPWRGWGQVQPQAADGLRSLFPPVVPHLHELF